MDSLPKIVHILYSGAGGQAGVCFPLIKAAGGDSVHALAFYGVEPVADINVQRCEELGIAWRGWIKQPGLSLGPQREMADWIVSQKADAVIAHSPAVLYACKRAKKRLPHLRIIAVEHHCNALKSARQWLLSAAILWRTDGVVYLTEAYRDEVKRKLGPLFRAKNTSIIPNGLDLDACSVSSPANAVFTAGMQGRMVDGKDFPTLLRAIALANDGGPSIHLELAGDGPRRAELEALTDSLGIRARVTFTGLLDHAALLRRVAGWHAYAHASMGETMSIAIMEAKACGLPIVASDAPGISPFFNDGKNGLLVPPSDPAAMAAALRRLAADAALCTRLGMAARQEAEERYSARRAWQSYRRVLFPARPEAASSRTAPVPAATSIP